MAGKIPDFTALGERPMPKPSGGVATYSVPGGLEAPGLELMREGRELQADGDKIFVAFQQEKEKADTVRVEDAWNKYQKETMQVTSGEGGALTTLGADAVNGDLLGKTTEKMRSIRENLEQSLTDEQKKRFKPRADTTDIQVGHQVLTHIDQQSRAYATTVEKASDVIAKEKIAFDPTDDALFARVLQDRVNSAEAYLKRNGIDKDTEGGKIARDSYLSNLTDSLYATRVEGLLSLNQPIQADDLLKKAISNGDIKSPVVRNHLKSSTQEAALSMRVFQSTETDISEGVVKLMQEKATKPVIREGNGLQQPGVITDTGQRVPMSVRNNNPGNITDTKTGEIRTFATREEGERALDNELAAKIGGTSMAYRRRFGTQPVTPERLAEVWSPAAAKGNSQESTTNYAKSIAAALGIGVGDQIADTPENRAKVKTAITAFEAGGSGVQTVAVRTASPQYDTDVLPNAKDIASLKSSIMEKSVKWADQYYGKDPQNMARSMFLQRREAEVTTQINKRVAELTASQNAALDAVKTAILGDPAAGGMTNAGGSPTGMVKLTSWGQVMNDPALARNVRMLDGAGKQTIDTMLKVSNNESQNGDYALFNTLRNEIANGQFKLGLDVLKDPRVQNGSLNAAQIHALEGWAKDPERGQAGMVKQATTEASKILFNNDPVLKAMGLSGLAESMFSRYADGVIAQFRKDNPGKPIGELLDPQNPKSLVYLPTLKQFAGRASNFSSEADALAMQAQKAREGTLPATTPAPTVPASVVDKDSRDVWLKSISSSPTFRMPDGSIGKNPFYAAGPAAPGAPAPAPAGTPADLIRPDGTLKGAGFLGPLKVPGTNSTATEYSVGVNIGGKQMDIPTLVPTLTKPEVDQVLAAAAKNEFPPEAVVAKARAFAEQRIKEGKPVFATAADKPAAAAPAPAKAKGDLPKFVNNEPTAEERAMHQGAMIEAVKAVVKLPVTMGRATMGIYQDIGEWLADVPRANRVAGARGALDLVLQKDSFTKQDLPTVRAAIKYGELDPQTRKKAEALLKAAGE